MEHIDLQSFIHIMRPKLEFVSKLAIANQFDAKKYSKCDVRLNMSKNGSQSNTRVCVVSQVDIEIQEILLQFIFKHWPFVSVLTEENTPTKSMFKSGQNYCILIDPIDGTKNYLSGNSQFCHIVSLMKEGKMLASMVASHAHNKLFVAIKDQGAYVASLKSKFEKIRLNMINGNILHYHVSRIPIELKDELAKIGYSMKPSSQNATDILNMLYTGTKGFISITPVVYDVWSPSMIINEAGGCLTDWNGQPPLFNYRTRVPHLLVTQSKKESIRILQVLKKYA